MFEVPKRRLSVEIGTRMVHRVFDQDWPEITEERAAGGTFYANIRGNACEQRITDVIGLEAVFQVRSMKAIVARFANHEIAALRSQSVDNLPVPSSSVSNLPSS